MQRIAIASSILNGIGYDAATQRLELQFKGGGTYEYTKVPAHVYSALLSAESKGAYFNSAIRGKFPYHRTECVADCNVVSLTTLS